MVLNFSDEGHLHQQKYSRRPWRGKNFSPRKDADGWVIEGEFEEVYIDHESIRPKEKPSKSKDNPRDRRSVKERRAKTTETVFETRAKDRRRKRQLVDLFV